MDPCETTVISVYSVYNEGVSVIRVGNPHDDPVVDGLGGGAQYKDRGVDFVIEVTATKDIHEVRERGFSAAGFSKIEPPRRREGRDPEAQ